MQISFIEEFVFSLWLVFLCCLIFCYRQRRQQQDHTSSYSTLKTMTTCVLGWSVSRLLLFPCNIALAKIMINLVGFNEEPFNCIALHVTACSCRVYFLLVFSRAQHMYLLATNCIAKELRLSIYPLYFIIYTMCIILYCIVL